MHPFSKFIILHIDEVTDEGENKVVKNKKARLPATSELHLLSSEKLNLLRAQAVPRRRKTLELLRAV